MATISGMQPSGSTAMPVNNTMGNTIKSSVSSNLQGASQQEVAQKIEQKRADITQLKRQETADLSKAQTQDPIDSAKLDSLMQNLNTELKQLQNYMKFERDKDSQNMVVFIKDSETGELIRQIPTQEFLNISKSITEFLEMQKQSSEKISPPVGMLTNEMA
ncbi:MAG TPA: flagellar protein FlaG [Thiomicrorhabdus sp.]|nr:flagellar protein FlaG [Thiomicrorhabdus sp.]